jgi:hypothetical protein
MAYIKVDDEAIDTFVRDELFGILTHPGDLNRKEVKSILRVAKYFTAHQDWLDYKKTDSYKELKKDFAL